MDYEKGLQVECSWQLIKSISIQMIDFWIVN
jgi:hypothetical protein